MDPPKYEGRSSPYHQAGLVSRLFYLWPTSLIDLCWRRPLRNDEVYFMPEEDTPQQNVGKLQREWNKELVKLDHGGTPKFWITICRAVGPFFMKSCWIALLEMICRLAQPVLFSYLLTYFAPDGVGISESQAWMCTGGIIFFCLLHITAGPHLVNQSIKAAIQYEGAANSLLYRKIMRLSQAALRGYSKGQIIDYITNDAFKPSIAVWYLHDIWISPFCALFSLYIMYSYVGIVAIIGMLVGLLSIPVAISIGRNAAKYRKQQSEMTDKRVSVITELVSAMRLVKMYCWEKPFSDKVAAIRRKELGFTWLDDLWDTILAEFSFLTNRLILATIITLYSLSGNSMNAVILFPVMTFFSVLQEGFLIKAPWGYRQWQSLKAPLKRIEDFLLAEELQAASDDNSCNEPTHIEHGDVVVSMTEVSAKWETHSNRLTLMDVTCTLKMGELVTIIGPVGCGKSSLLMVLLDELPVLGGQKTIAGQLSYAAQLPWVFSSSIRQNILMGQDLDLVRYNQVLRATALDKDMEIFPKGDLTLGGDRGVTLSGGQKARVNLARALYRHADVYLLDDPLSAVDTKVGKHIFKSCIKGFLKGKLCILVTHQLQYLADSDRIILLNKGRIEAEGNYEQLRTSGVDFVKVLSELDNPHTSRGTSGQESVEDTIPCHSEGSGPERQEEDRETGNVKFGVFFQYFRYGGGYKTLTVLVLLFIGAQLFFNLSDWWIAHWSLLEDVDSKTNTEHGLDQIQEVSATYLSISWKLAVYLGISVVVCLLGVARIVVFYRVCVTASQNLHDQMFSSVMRSPIHFFDETPTGRLVNRFSRDIHTVDRFLPRRSREFLKNFSVVIGSMAMIVFYSPLVLLPTVPMVIALIYTNRRFLNTLREVQRLEASRRSPYLSHINSTLEGLETLRALKLQDKCIRDFDQLVELMMNASFTENCIFSWIRTQMNIVASLFVTVTVLGCMVTSKSLRAEDAGLVILNAVPMMWFLGNVTRISGDAEITFVQAERVMAYTKLPPEAPLKSKVRPHKTWPRGGAIDFCDVSFQYSTNSPIVLHHVTFSVQAGEKIGIVGRTGAGKSSLVQALFRLAEPKGQILIDGLNINTLGLHDLRNNISIIPQDPVMFGGTVRQNLDPFGQYEDDILWQCLEEVHLTEVVWKLADGLESVVSEGGSNFSLGERQLFCLARAILKETKILVLDEATANVDINTDQWIQETIRHRFEHCTVLTIAHRLNTVMNADRIMVLEKGHLEEFDKPSVLLKNQQGYLYKLVEQTGTAEQQRLMQLADGESLSL